MCENDSKELIGEYIFDLFFRKNATMADFVNNYKLFGFKMCSRWCNNGVFGRLECVCKFFSFALFRIEASHNKLFTY